MQVSPMTKLPETDLGRIRRYCESQVPAELQDQIRVEYRIRGSAVTSRRVSPLLG